ncbi:MAG: 2-polyprenyl-3-methyl-6-methoxy-1,4-benzoquinone monooxygenase [Gammaproteobacteria bacterium]|nr:2-polyprenyl-3-methyl-6-methoxy-1,4-benzoquinone monooxygenase [Gammaproteobacteria bacterium]
MTAARRLTRLDRLVLCLDRLHAERLDASAPERPNPAGEEAATDLPAAQRQRSARLMRVNHSGEICAQALYVGQAAFARNDRVAAALQQAADEESDHLHWCQQRLRELGTRASRLNLFWLAGSLAIGGLASLAGDRWSLGFLAETERQVVDHLEGHLRRLPSADGRSRAIIAAMREDEARHATNALAHGAAELPRWLRELMRLSARVMTSVAARI